MNPRWRLCRVAAAVATGLVVAACGGGGAGQPPGAMTAQMQTQPQAQPDTTEAVDSPAAIGMATADGNQTEPAIARLADGGHVVAWTHEAGGADAGGRIRLQGYDAGGAATGAEVALDTTRDVAGRPAIAALAGGGFVLAWTAGDSQAGAYPGGPAAAVDFFVQRFDAQARPLGAAVQVNAVSSQFFNASKVVGLADGGFVVAWATETGQATNPMRRPHVVLRRFGADGTSAGEERRLRTGFEPQPSFALAQASDGGFVVAWEQWLAPDSAGIFVQRFDRTAAPSAAAVRLDGGDDPAPSLPAMASLANGGQVLAWDTGRADAAEGRVAARLIAADGTAGPRVAVPTGPLGIPAAPAVAGLDDGSFVVSWLSARIEGRLVSRELRAQGYDAAGAALRSVQSLGSSQLDVSVRGATCACNALAGTQEGGFALAMQGYGAATSWDVWVGRR